MKKKSIVLLFIILASLFFVVSMIIATNKFVASAHTNIHEYTSKKKIAVAGKIIDAEKVSGQNKLVELNISHFENEPLEKTNSIGFRTLDSSKVFIVVLLPKEYKHADSLSTSAIKTQYFKNGKIIGETKPELMRWATMQNLKVTTEKNRNINLEYLY